MPDTDCDLARFQDAFMAALLAPDAVPADAGIARLVAQPGFAVYRNTGLKACIDALQAGYPAVARLVGEEWFRAAAAVYARAAPPRSAVLLEYGNGFADFLDAFEPAREFAWLPGVARVDRFWTEAHVAADEPALAADAIAGIDPERLGAIVLRPHASAHWAWFDAHPIRTIWTRNRDATGVQDADLDWLGEGVLVVRPVAAVEVHPLGAAGCAFLEACARSQTLLEAALAALDVEPGADLTRLMSHLVAAGAFAQPIAGEPSPTGDLP